MCSPASCGSRAPSPVALLSRKLHDAAGGRLFVSTYGGNLQCIDGDAAAWRIVTELEDDRFFHRMLLFHDRLLLVGGASMKSGQRRHLEAVELSRLE